MLISKCSQPNREDITISALYGETEDEIPNATCGDQVRIRIRGVEEEDILPGFVLCAPQRPVHCVSAFEAQIALLELKSILSAGFNCVLHVHSAIEEVTFAALLHKLEKGTGRKSKKPPAFGKQGMSIIARLEITGAAGRVCVEKYVGSLQSSSPTPNYTTLECCLRPRNILNGSADSWIDRYEDYPQMGRYVYVRDLIFLLRLTSILQDLFFVQNSACHLSNCLIARSLP